MEILVFAGIPVLLLLLLSLLGATWNLDVDPPEERTKVMARRGQAGEDPGVCIRRIFSSEDQKFVERQGLPRLREIYRAERTRVALFWVRSVSAEVAEIMREHRVAAGTRQNLRVRRELLLILQYVEFRVVCGLLAFSIRVFGPHALANLATHLLQVSQGIGRVLEEGAAASQIQPEGSLG
ncbi:MAG TPA: hypothetical protein VMH31_16270 [Methylomirabilota bacterium]|nr:hypothetical protein [Methylomirabilota bacterium]